MVEEKIVRKKKSIRESSGVEKGQREETMRSGISLFQRMQSKRGEQKKPKRELGCCFLGLVNENITKMPVTMESSIQQRNFL